MIKRHEITVAVVVRNEEAYIQQCLNSLKEQKDVPEFSICIVDSSSNDKTSEICKNFVSNYSDARYVSIAHKGIGYARKCAVELVDTPLIAFLDGDCVAPHDWLHHLSKGYYYHKNKDPLVAAVGGSHRAFADSNTFQRVAELFKSSLLGSGSSAYRGVTNQDIQVYHIPTANVLYDTDIIKRTPPDPAFQVSNEDVDVSYRITHQGYRLMQLKESFVFHKMQATLFQWIRSMFGYGFGKMQLMLKHRFQSITLFIFLLPILGLLFGIIALSLSTQAFLWLVLVYAVIVIIETLRIASKSFSLYTFFILLILFPITHISYAVGELYYLVMLPFKPTLRS